LNDDGTVIVTTGNPDIGGSRASMAMMAAEVLGIDLDRVTPMIADTNAIAYTDLTGGSRVTFAVGMTVSQAATEMVAELKRRAARVWDVDIDRVSWRDGAAHAVRDGTPLCLTIAELAAQSPRTGGPVATQVSINAQGAGPGFATHICDVEVDPDTGKVTVLRYTAVQDVGRAIHPDFVEGQIQGGVAQGLGWALNEAYIYDENGLLQNPGFLDYRVPVASDLPMIDTILVEVPNPRHPFGVKGVGEVPIVPPLGAAANAIARAMQVRLTHLPMSPPSVVKAVKTGAARRR
jgi:CO/xanthine dehydrogenase Mo-binding subunit